jgi:hypothetical protein
MSEYEDKYPHRQVRKPVPKSGPQKISTKAIILVLVTVLGTTGLAWVIATTYLSVTVPVTVISPITINTTTTISTGACGSVGGGGTTITCTPAAMHLQDIVTLILVINDPVTAATYTVTFSSGDVTIATILLVAINGASLTTPLASPVSHLFPAAASLATTSFTLAITAQGAGTTNITITIGP